MVKDKIIELYERIIYSKEDSELIDNDIASFYSRNGKHLKEIRVFNGINNFISEFKELESIKNISSSYRSLPNFKLRNSRVILKIISTDSKEDVWKHLLKELSDESEKHFEDLVNTWLMISSSPDILKNFYQPLIRAFQENDISIKSKFKLIPDLNFEIKEILLLNLLMDGSYSTNGSLKEDFFLRTSLMIKYYYYFFDHDVAYLINKPDIHIMEETCEHPMSLFKFDPGKDPNMKFNNGEEYYL